MVSIRARPPDGSVAGSVDTGVENSTCCARSRAVHSFHAGLAGRSMRTRSRTNTSGLATIW